MQSFSFFPSITIFQFLFLFSSYLYTSSAFLSLFLSFIFFLSLLLLRCVRFYTVSFFLSIYVYIFKQPHSYFLSLIFSFFPFVFLFIITFAYLFSPFFCCRWRRSRWVAFTDSYEVSNMNGMADMKKAVRHWIQTYSSSSSRLNGGVGSFICQSRKQRKIRRECASVWR